MKASQARANAENAFRKDREECDLDLEQMYKHIDSASIRGMYSHTFYRCRLDKSKIEILRAEGFAYEQLNRASYPECTISWGEPLSWTEKAKKAFTGIWSLPQ